MSQQRQKINGLLALVIIASTIPYTNEFPGFLGYVPVIILYTTLVFYLFIYRSKRLQIHHHALFLLGTVWIIYLYHLIFSAVNVSMFVRVPVFISASLISLFYLPYTISLNDFSITVAVVSAFLGALGILTVFVGGYHIFIFDVTPWPWSFKIIPYLPFEVNPIKSIYNNPNPFSQLVLVGTFTAAIAYVRTRITVLGLVTVLNLFSLYLSNSRGALLALVVGIGFTALSAYGQRWQATAGVLALAAGMSLLVLVLLNYLPSVQLLENIDLSGRAPLWRGALNAVMDRPYIGFGPGQLDRLIEPFLPREYRGGHPHSSYMRMLVTTGFFGFVGYVLFLITTAEQLARTANDLGEKILFGLVVALILHQMFELYSLFGVSSSSLLSSLVFGYALSVITKYPENQKQLYRNPFN